MPSIHHPGTVDFEDADKLKNVGKTVGAEERPGTNQSENDTLRSDLAEMQDRWMRSEAETANVRARAKRDVEEARQFAVQKFAADVVEGAEDLKRGLNSLPPATENEPNSIAGLRAGLSEIQRGFAGMLARNGVKAEDPTGMLFAPALHQAIGERDDSGHPPGTVLKSLAPVWTLNGRLLRPAIVIVAKAPAAPSAAGPRHGDELDR